MASFLSLMVNLNRSLKHSQQPLQKSLAAPVQPLTRLQLPKAVRHRQLHHRQQAPQAAAAAVAVAQPAAAVVKVYQQLLQIH